MKKMKQILAFVLATVMVLAMSVTAFAQNVDSNAGGSASITINNASKGETYKVYKLFDATVTGDENGSIAYQGTIPESLGNYFKQDPAGNISVVDEVNEAELFDALKTWAKTTNAVISEKSDGSTLTFTGLTYGYYVVTSTQGSGANITVTSTNPNATIYDKNSTKPTIPENGDLKSVNDADVSIGDIVTYTIKFVASNYDGAGQDATKINEYTITDTLPDFLDNVNVTSITVGGVKIDVQQFTNGQIKLDWVDGNGNSLYDNGAEVVITYTGKVTDKMAVGGDANANKNTVTVTWNGNNGDPITDTEVIKTYAAAIQKVDGSKKNLAGAKFSAKGLTVTGSNGNYTVTSYDGSEDAVAGTEMECDANGYLVIKGLASDVTLTVTETAAPDGYNKLTETFEVTPTLTSTTITTTVDKETSVVTVKGANLTAIEVVNETGSVLPSTGGMGTTIFYVVGAILVAGAAILLVTKKRMSASK